MTFAIGLREVYREKLGGPEAVKAYIAAKPEAVHRRMIPQTIEEALQYPVVRRAIGIFEQLFGDMESTLARGPWLLGEDFSLADVGYAPYITRADCLQLDFLWERRPHVGQWYERLKSRPTYQSAIADWLVKDEVERMRENGKKARATLQQMLSEA